MSPEMSLLTELKKEVDESVAALEKQIFDLEESYYMETPFGNLMKGWEGFLDSKLASESTQKRRNEPRMEPENRMFSYSSWTFWTESALMAPPIEDTSEQVVSISSTGRGHKNKSNTHNANQTRDGQFSSRESQSSRERESAQSTGLKYHAVKHAEKGIRSPSVTSSSSTYRKKKRRRKDIDEEYDGTG